MNKDVYNFFKECEDMKNAIGGCIMVAKNEITDAVVSQTGCIGICQYEPVVEIYEGETKTTYVKMDAEKVQRVVSEHVIGKRPVTEFTIGALKAE